MADELFRDTPIRKKVNPFGEDDAEGGAGSGSAGDAEAIEYAASRIRRLKSQVGAEGLTLSATRELLDHISAALDAAARALRQK